MNLRYIYLTLLLLGTLALTACSGSLFSINLNVVDQKTALEQQVLGTYGELGRDLTAYASVRGVNPDGTLAVKPERTDSQAAVMQAFSNRRYNRDDIQDLLDLGVVGEANTGLLIWRDENIPDTLEYDRPLAEELVNEENRDRQTILQRLMTTTPGVGDQDREEVEFVFAELNQELAPIGAYIQGRDGAWRQKQ